MILPGAGTLIGGIGGAFIGVTLSGFVGSLIGSELGKQFDPKRSFLDRHEIEKRIEKEIFHQKLEMILEYNKGVVESLFHQFDIEGKDIIEAKKIKYILLNLGIYMNSLEVENLLKQMKKSEKDHVTFFEFETMFKDSLNCTILRNRISTLFQMYGIDAKGSLNFENFHLFYTNLTHDFYEKTIESEKVFEIVGKDGYVFLNNFVIWMIEFLKKFEQIKINQ